MPAKKQPEVRGLPNVDRTAGARALSGLVPEQWNAAIRVLVAVRDVMQRPIELVYALDIVADLISRGGLNASEVERWRTMFDNQQKEIAAEKSARNTRERAAAGRKSS